MGTLSVMLNGVQQLAVEMLILCSKLEGRKDYFKKKKKERGG